MTDDNSHDVFSFNPAGGTPEHVPLRKLCLPPQSERIRQLNPNRVLALLTSIGLVGLLQALTIDKQNRVVAGAHRLAALLLFAAPPGTARIGVWCELFGRDSANDAVTEGLNRVEGKAPVKVPVVRLAFSAEQEPHRAEVAQLVENENRADFTREDLLAYAEGLRKAGYRTLAGRPAANEKALIPALVQLTGKSRATICRWLKDPQSPDSNKKETVSNEAVNAQRRAALSLKRATTKFIASTEGAESPPLSTLRSALQSARFLKAIEAATAKDGKPARRAPSQAADNPGKPSASVPGRALPAEEGV